MEFLTEELRKKYHMADFEIFCKWHEEIEYYQTFLIQTDHISSKIAEAAYLGEETEDYTEILQARKYCRKKINEIMEETNELLN